MLNERIEFASKPGWAWLIVGAAVVALLVWSHRRAAGRRAPARRGLVLGLRLLVVAVVALCLLDPQRVREVRRLESGCVGLLLDTSRSMGVADLGRARIETATTWIRNSLRLPRHLQLRMFHFDRKLDALPSLEAVTLAGDRTDIGGALGGLRCVAANEPLESVLLISDGAENVSRNAAEVARQFGRDKVPIHTLCVGTDYQAPGVRIAGVETRPVYTRQATIHVIATVASPGCAGHKTEWRVSQDDKPVAKQPLTLNGATQQVDIEFQAPRDGFQTFVLEIPADPGERQTDNHRREFGLTVSNPKLRVIYMEGTGEEDDHPEILDLKWALEDEGFEVRALYHEQFKPTPPGMRDAPAYVDPRTGQRIYRVGHSRLGYPKTLEELLRFHVVICSDIDKALFTQEQLQNTVRFVEEFGGGFVMVGGVTAFGAGHWSETSWERIIPVEMELEHDTTFDLFVPRIPAESRNHPLLKVADNPAENRRIWTERFPPLAGFNRVDRAKPGAVTLLVHPSLTTRYGPSVILAAQEIGKGRSMAFTTDTTSVWGYEFEKYWGEPDPSRKPASGRPGTFPPRASACDNRYYRRFWANAMRWLAANKFAQEQGSTQIALDRDEVLPGEEVAVSAKVLDKTGKTVRDANVTVSLLQDDKEIQVVPATGNQSAAVYRAILTPPSPGRFVVRAQARRSGIQELEARQLLVCANRDVEMTDAQARPELLAEIARNSGGQVLSLTAEPAKLTATLAGDKLQAADDHRQPLWDTWVWLATIVGLLTLEWVARRRVGLA